MDRLDFFVQLFVALDLHWIGEVKRLQFRRTVHVSEGTDAACVVMKLPRHKYYSPFIHFGSGRQFRMISREIPDLPGRTKGDVSHFPAEILIRCKVIRADIENKPGAHSINIQVMIGDAGIDRIVEDAHHGRCEACTTGNLVRSIPAERADQALPWGHAGCFS
ncbi:MAG: hypothetical protein C4530_06395 [Desulfobacteraceae bacterium]|nr:MAG: hypothetical protein C4530_06395 [Desulfobacteraceae bacterium]